MPENRLDIPCDGGTLIVATSGDGIEIKFVTPDGRVWDSKSVILEGKRLLVK